MNKKCKMMLSVLCIIALLLPVGLFAGGQKEAEEVTAAAVPKKGGTLNIGLHIPLATLDWQSTMSHPLPHVLVHVFEGLFAYGKDFTPVPELVDSYETSADSKVWTFSLRRGVLFHNGDELEAVDVKASILRWKQVAPKGKALAGLERIETPDKYTVKMYFKEPMGYALLLAVGSDANKAIVMPKEVAEASPQGGNLTDIIGTGPYQFEEYREDQYVRLKRFENYVSRDDAPDFEGGKKNAYLDEIIFWIVPEAPTRVAGLESGEYDFIYEVPDSEYRRLNSVEGVVPVKNGPGVLLYMMFNHKTGPTSNIKIREAIRTLLDIDEVAGVAVSDPEFRVIDPSFYPPESSYNTKVRSELYDQNDIEKAKELLREAGYAGELITHQVISTSPRNVRVGVAVVEQMKKAGINAEVGNYDLATWVAKRRDPNELNIYTSAGYWFDPLLYHPEFNGTFPSEGVAFYSDETEKVFTQLLTEGDFEKRYKLGEELQKLFYDKIATINLGYIYRLVAKQDYVMDPEGDLARMNGTFSNVWLNK